MVMVEMPFLGILNQSKQSFGECFKAFCGPVNAKLLSSSIVMQFEFKKFFVHGFYP